MGKVVRLEARSRPAAHPMPDRLSVEECERLLRWAGQQGYCMEEVLYATRRVRDWARSRAKEPQKRDWVRAVMNALRDGWALKGQKLEAERRGRRQRRELSEAFIEKYLAWIRENPE